jgi:predicted permease
LFIDGCGKPDINDQKRKRMNQMNTFANDIKYSFRQLVKSPGFTVVAVLSLAFGIGANTAIFSLLNAVLLRSLPVPRARELRVIDFTSKGYSFTSFYGGYGSQTFPYPAYASFRDHAQGFSEVFAFSDLHNMTAITPPGAITTHGLMVSGNYFSGYGAHALIGRTITPEDDQPDAALVTVITYRAWERYFGADPSVIGKTVALNKTGFTIVGVLPRGYVAPISGDPADFYVPMIAAQPRLKPGWSPDSAEHWWVQIMARRNLAIHEDQALASLSLPFSQFLETSPDSLEEPRILLRDGRSGLGSKDNAQPLWILQALVALILLIACANLASLLLARGAARRHERAVRAAIGAGRWSLMRQALTESFLLSLSGAGLGLLFSVWIKMGLTRFFVAQEQGVHINAAMDGRVLAFTLAIAILTTLLCGMLPAWQAGRMQPLAGLKDNRTQGAPRLRIGKALIAIQMGLSILLVMGTGLLIRTLFNLHQVDPGFNVGNLLVFRVNPGQAGYKGQDLVGFYERTRQALAGIPGTRLVAFSDKCLLSGDMGSSGFSIPGRSDLARSQTQTHILIISDNFLETMGIPLLSGRQFDAADSDGAANVAIANDTFAQRFFPRGDALGKYITWGKTDYQIVGLCRDAVYENLRQTIPPTLYFPSTQHHRGRMTFLVRSVVPPMSLVSAVRQSLARIDRSIPLEEIATQEQVVKKSIAVERLFAGLCSGLTLVALALSCIGLYGLMAYNVARRTGEMGIRMAFGARPRDVARPVLFEAVVLAGIGAVIGIPIALMVTQLLRSVLFGIKPHDPTTVAGSIILLISVAAMAAWIPARRAAKIDPMEALRYE